MRPVRLLLASLALLPAALAGEIATLKGEAVTGKILSVSADEVAYEDKAGERQKVAIKDVLKIDFREAGTIPPETSYGRVELTDGTALFVSKWTIRRRELTMTLLSGPVVTVPLSTVANVLSRAGSAKSQADWKLRTFNTRGGEALVFEKDGVTSNIPATLGDGDAEGKTIAAAVSIEGEAVTRKVDQEKLHGLIFKTVLDPKAKPVVCKLFDTIGNAVMVSDLAPKEGGLTVTTPSGAKFDFTYEQVSRLDYAKGKLDYVSTLDPTKVVSKSNLDEDTKPDQWHVYTNTNLNKGPLSLGGVKYASGLAIKPFCELTYELKGEYREFSALVGLDDDVSASGKTILVVEGDGKELGTVEISSDDKKRFKPLTLNIKDVQQLKITVKADGEFDLARHLDLADAKVSK